jgi:hypothetical protein
MLGIALELSSCKRIFKITGKNVYQAAFQDISIYLTIQLQTSFQGSLKQLRVVRYEHDPKT